MKINIKKRFYVTITLITVLIFAGAYYIPRVIFPLDYYETVVQEAQKNNIDPLLVMAVIKAESSFQPNVSSVKDAKGLMQLQESTAQWCAEKMAFDDYRNANIYDPATNIKIGTWYLGTYLMNYYDNDLTLALAAYNAGVGNVDKWLGNPSYSDGVNLLRIPFKETEKYIERINTYYELYKLLY